jgi:hypothetical protein
MTRTRTPRAAPFYRPGTAAALLLCAAFLAACGDEPTAPNVAPGVSAATAAPAETSEQLREDALATDLARAMARALAEPSLRGTMKRAMREARNREHKLDLRSYLASKDAARLAKAVAEELELAPGGLASHLQSIPALELYVPVRAHRAAWRGGSELIVAAGLHEEHAPAGFAVGGAAVELDLAAAPAQPVLILTKVETDFNKALDESAWKNVDDAGGSAIGTMVRVAESTSGSSDGSSDGSAASLGDVSPMMLEEDPCIDNPYAIECAPSYPPTPTYPTRPPGIWIESIYVNDYEEPWYRGTAEITVLLTAPGMNGFSGSVLSCSGQYALTQAGQNDAAMKYFDQSGHSWSRKPELLEGLLFGRTDIAQFSQLYQVNIGLGIDMWEDDSDGGRGVDCGYDGGATDVQAFIRDMQAAYGVLSQVVRIMTPTIAMSPVAIGISLAQAIRRLMSTGSDLMLGHAVNVRLADGTHSQTQYRLIRERWFTTFYGSRIQLGTEDNGYINLTIINP